MTRLLFLAAGEIRGEIRANSRPRHAFDQKPIHAAPPGESSERAAGRLHSTYMKRGSKGDLTCYNDKLVIEYAGKLVRK